jgi:uroporphyrinogen III methyltransferase/synthase
MSMSQSQPQLAGKTIAITRPAAQADAVMAQLRALGAIPISTPTIAIVPPENFTRLDAAIGHLSSYDWLLFTSVNGVHVVLERLDALGVERSVLGSVKIGAIGPSTARALQAGGGTAAFVPTTYTAEGILAEIGPVRGQRLLLPRAELARPTLAAGLRHLGAEVDEIAAYRTVPGLGIAVLEPLLRAGSVNAVTFTSSSTVRFLYEGLVERAGTAAEIPAMLASCAVVCIGPVTAATATTLGLRVDVVADSYTIDGLVAALEAFFSRPESSGGLT